MNKNGISTLITVIIVVVLVVAGIWYYESAQSTPVVYVNPGGATTTPVTSSTVQSQTGSSSAIVYTNSQYGFTFSLPADWQGYTIVTSTWQGTSLEPNVNGVIASGTKLIIRNPKWTAAMHYEDIPVLIFTAAQWNSYIAGNYAVSAAPISATEIGYNNRYVFALPPRWDYDYSQGYQEADSIVQSNPLKGFNL